ncbi:lipid II:glycine glycyltransferase FemX [Breznakiella homolactica]|uniref:Peptidoglycan bridge formation glycyltransferase FemA/FemB family protein n=1 Tax=Breznakiella homolactica TaxID=2798577 RepID=A0A7T8B943_9SPIR|nr:peptidoglycan bridge formation glycyltransferase FemA/FemB family protein [Breznakiella homolactica]QQO07956.1 peptidoglycan bridge formation glycyltransferase FemA/FemB family protein [Breznakiella homolactica]
MAGPGQFPIRGLIPADLASCNRASSFLQSAFWGSFKARFGWNARAFLIEWEYAEPTPLLVIRRRLAPGITFAYVPWGPELPAGFPDSDNERNGLLLAVADHLKPLLSPDTAFIRFDPPWYSEGADAAPPPVFQPFARSGADIQPPDTVIVSLAEDEEAILSQMKPKWRYNIRLAEKKGVTVRRQDAGGLDTFYRLYGETAKRDGIAIHGIDYYKTLFSHAADYPGNGQDLRLYTADHEGETLAAVIIIFRGTTATYLYGASGDTKRNLMAPYALQWQAMKDAKAAGCLEYDLFGIPPRDDPGHPMAGLYRFKTGFGGRIIHRPGSWDYTYRHVMRRLFNAAETLRKKLRDAKKRQRYRKNGL